MIVCPRASVVVACLCVFVLAACGSQGGDGLPAAPRQLPVPPVRTAWTAAPIEAQIAHARALHSALMVPADGVEVTWAAGGYSGAVTPIDTRVQNTLLCRAFRDNIRRDGAQGTAVVDVACMLARWAYLRPGDQPAVLEPAFLDAYRVFTLSTGGRMADVGRLTGVPLDTLQFWNPGFDGPLQPGTRILLP